MFTADTVSPSQLHVISSLFKATEVEQLHTAPNFGRQFVPVAAQRTEKSSYNENCVRRIRRDYSTVNHRCTEVIF